MKATVIIKAVSLRAVITDWGGVLTPPIAQLVRAWADADHINWEAYVSVITPWLTAAYDVNGAPNPVHALERGESTPRPSSSGCWPSAWSGSTAARSARTGCSPAC